jgi:hypothetical protein
MGLRRCKPAPLSSPCAGSAPQDITQPPPTQNFGPSMDLKEQNNGPRNSYEESTDLIRGIHPDRIMEACSNGGPFSTSTSYLEDAGIKISGYGRRLTSHARTWR